MTDEPRTSPIRSADPFARIGLGIAIALLVLIASFQISAHFAHNETSRELRTADNALQAFCTRFAVDCEATTTTTTTEPASPTTTTPHPASSSPSPSGSVHANATTTTQSRPSAPVISVPIPAASTTTTAPPATTTSPPAPTTTTTLAPPPVLICTPQIAFLPPVCI